ncbi:MAG: ribonuclease III [Clostridia bacterium]|nr:ribonuclease III [Clostridia bacterium]
MERFLGFDCNPNQLSPLTLAFIGDCVYELFVREKLVCEANRPTNKLNNVKREWVNASFQAQCAIKIGCILTDEEADILRRGRNAQTKNTPKNMSSSDYHYATGLEALFGYLYLCGKIERLRELFYIISQNGDDNCE